MSTESSDRENAVTADLTGSSFSCVMDTGAIHHGRRVREIERKINVGELGYEDEGREQHWKMMRGQLRTMLLLHCFLRVVLDSQQNCQESTEISHMFLAPTHA